jgi:hypothetical protein
MYFPNIAFMRFVFHCLTLQMEALLSSETSETARSPRQSLNSEDVVQKHRWKNYKLLITLVNLQFCCPAALTLILLMWRI